ncbi:YkyA family protein [Sporosarcina jeotgali]|uniref:YkyA family protein n=1 Tax=Sporosarcina jeotgali TaxID=3020056 RepID=A0ABZ0KYV7_9BACL|nr:YkyA family protein [Sporosarcina sp. B2O-1]WOV85145.1 YkyA family protein [Sporosarcina sp. B2O-1]
MQKVLLVVPMCLLLLIGGCTEEKDAMQKELGSILTSVHENENKVMGYENQLANLEKKEQILFEKTVAFNIEDRELIESGVNRLTASLEERRELLSEEEAVIGEAEETAKRLDDLPSASSDEGTRSVAKLKTALSRRYELHHEVIGLYKELMESQNAVYELLIEENVKRVELEEATAAVNGQRAKLEDLIQVFNQSTLEVNGALKETQQVETE